ncbi:MAG: hypothetical protein D6677_04780 [Calditrichaeota bacterium]|nr:MAG: hypothetical protein D6677_04780 [Calditrichota bacterium]
MSKVYVKELEDFLNEKGKNITREECFALYGYAYGLYISHKLTTDEFIEIENKIPVDNKELEAVTL